MDLVNQQQFFGKLGHHWSPFQCELDRLRISPYAQHPILLLRYAKAIFICQNPFLTFLNIKACKAKLGRICT